MRSSLLFVAAVLLLSEIDAKAASFNYGSVAATRVLYSVRGTSFCALLGNTRDFYVEAAPDENPDPEPVFGNAEQLPLSACREPHDFVCVDVGRYLFLSEVTEGIMSGARNYTFTFCVNADRKVPFSCYRSHGQNGSETYFVAPTDYERVLVRGPVGYHECPQAFEGMLDVQLPLVEDERQCATFLSVTSYSVRTGEGGECGRLSRYGLFKDYPEVWNDCQRYAQADSGNVFYDCLFDPNSEPWNYPTQEEVTRCADTARPVTCSSVFDAKADGRYFHAGRGKGEMTQNKFDAERCQRRDTGYDRFLYSPGASERGYYTPSVAIGALAVGVAVIVGVALRVVCYLSNCDASGSEHASVRYSALPDGAIPMSPTDVTGPIRTCGTRTSAAPALPNNVQEAWY